MAVQTQLIKAYTADNVNTTLNTSSADRSSDDEHNLTIVNNTITGASDAVDFGPSGSSTQRKRAQIAYKSIIFPASEQIAAHVRNLEKKTDLSKSCLDFSFGQNVTGLQNVYSAYTDDTITIEFQKGNIQAESSTDDVDDDTLRNIFWR